MKRKTSANYFAVAAILCPSPEAITECEKEIQQVRASLGLPENYEFHFGRIKDRHRRELLGRLAKCDFSYSACYLDKTDVHGGHWSEKEFFYQKVLGALANASEDFLVAAQTLKGKPLNAKVISDDNNDPVWFKILRQQFRILTMNGKPLVDKIAPGRSRSSDMLQLADMVCGAVVRFYNREKDYLDLLKGRPGKITSLF